MLVYFMAIWSIFHVLVPMLYQEKSGSPDQRKHKFWGPFKPQWRDIVTFFATRSLPNAIKVTVIVVRGGSKKGKNKQKIFWQHV
jgi:hypothetical protein